MNTLEMKICPNCNLLYEIKSLSPVLKGTIPLFLKCGHSMCESCVVKFVNNGEPTVNISCKFCQTLMEVMASDLDRSNLTHFYKTFPINTFMLGELLLQLYNTDKNHIEQKDCFINLKEILQRSEILKRECSKCQAITKKMCNACSKAMCETCYEKEHDVQLLFTLHKLRPIGTDELYENICKVHDMKQLEYYCTNCEKATCVDCLIIGGSKSCRNHDIISITEKNESLLGELSETAPKVDEVYKRLTKTAVDVGHVIQNIECDFGSAAEYTKLIGDVEQHFSKLYFTLDKHKKEIKDIINQNKTSELESLNAIKSNIAMSIKKATEVINSIEVVKKADAKNKRNVAALLEDAKLIVNTPWYLKKNRGESPKVEVNNDLNTSIGNYIHLDGDLQTHYNLSSTHDISDGDAIAPPPDNPVFPPKIKKVAYTMKTINDVCSPSFFRFSEENLNNRFESSLSSLKDESNKKRGDFMNVKFGFQLGAGSNATTNTVATTGSSGGLFGSGSSTTTKTVATIGTTGGLFNSSFTGAQQKAKPIFGSGTSPTSLSFGTPFGASTSGLGFGSNNTVSKPFGVNNTNTEIFGSKNTSAGLIGFKNTSGGLFSSNNTSRGFGSNNTNGRQFGSNNTSGILFENKQNTITGVGFDCTTTRTIQGPFSSTSTTTRVFGQQTVTNTGGTAHVKFDPVVGQDDAPFGRIAQVKHCTITAMKEYEGKSLEELRLEDYRLGNNQHRSGSQSDRPNFAL